MRSKEGIIAYESQHAISTPHVVVGVVKKTSGKAMSQVVGILFSPCSYSVTWGIEIY